MPSRQDAKRVAFICGDPILIQEANLSNLFTMDTVLEPLIRSPKLPACVQELATLLGVGEKA